MPSVFSSMEMLRSLARKLGCNIEFSKDVSPLKMPITVGELTFPNRVAIHPLEGADASAEGAPTSLTRERYLKYARGGAGLIWFEACAFDFPEARTHDALLVISKETLPTFKKLVKEVKRVSEKSLSELGFQGSAILVLQLTHAGRFRVKKSERSPALVYRFKELDHPRGVTEGVGRVLTDSELDHLLNAYRDAATLAFDAGFDAVDVKACHGYLLNDLLSSYTRGGRYGGEEFEKRTKFLLDTIKTIRDETSIGVTSRLNAYDGFPPPYGFGSSGYYSSHSPYESLPEYDLTEPIRLLHHMKALGVDVVNITLGNPHYMPALTRPYDGKVPGSRDSPEHPMESVNRHFEVVERLKRNVPQMVFVGSGYSWLRQYSIYAASHNIRTNRTDIVGWGRLALALPTFPRITFSRQALPSSQVCVTCSSCSQLLRAGLQTGCVIQNPDVYGEPFRQLTRGKK